MGCQHSTPIPTQDDFNYFLPMPTTCLSDNIRPHMFPGNCLDLRYQRYNCKSTKNGNNRHRHHARIIAKSSQQGNYFIGTVDVEKDINKATKNTHSTILVVRDSKGKLCAVICERKVVNETLSSTEDSSSASSQTKKNKLKVYDIYSVNPFVSNQCPTWSYKRLPLYYWSQVKSESFLKFTMEMTGGTARTNVQQEQQQQCESSQSSSQDDGTYSTGSSTTCNTDATTISSSSTSSSTTCNNSTSRYYETNEVGSIIGGLFRRNMIITTNDNKTRMYAIEQRKDTRCCTWQLSIGPSTDPFLMISFIAIIDRIHSKTR